MDFCTILEMWDCLVVAMCGVNSRPSSKVVRDDDERVGSLDRGIVICY